MVHKLLYVTPDFTVHDISHIDALWEMASLVAGSEIILNPIEAFVFGSSVLLHDLGMASAAYVNGVNLLYKGVEWEDALELVLRRYLGRKPNNEERQSPPNEVRSITIANRLRALHAVHAEMIPQIKWETEDGNVYRLLEDQELLDELGELIGRIAASHWWPIDKVESELNFEVGPPSSYPSDWGIDVLKIACLLRVADAAHIDKRRAPGFLRAIRNPQGLSGDHWKFQNRISRPTVKNGQLIYNSNRVFTERDMEAWWVAYDTVCMIDSELLSVEKLLKEHREYTFEAKGVKGVENPKRLTSFIRVNGWIPLDARVHVSDLPKLVQKLGGEALYGKSPTAPLRELIANSCDAIEASRKIGGLVERTGRVIVRIGKDSDDQEWLEVEDNGVGMSSKTLTDKLLDFGTSYWDTDLMLEEHPGLFSSGFNPIGKFGIGFFSVFMYGDKIRVVSRSVHSGPDDTNVLSFSEGLNKRPVLLKSRYSERMRDSGTIVRIYLKNIEEKVNDMFVHMNRTTDYRLSDLIENMDLTEKLKFVCRKLAPCLNADLYCQVYNEPKVKIIQAQDWKTISEYELLLRLTGFEENPPEEIRQKIEKFKETILPIFSETGELIGRATIGSGDIVYQGLTGVITCGGLTMEPLWRIYGVLVGEVNSASRNSGQPIVSKKVISDWATDQAKLIKNKTALFEDEDMLGLSSIILVLGGDPGELPICETNKGYLNFDDVKNTDWPEEIVLTHTIGKKYSEIEYLNDNVIMTGSGIPGISNNWPERGQYSTEEDLEHLVRVGILESWGIEEKEKSSYFSDQEKKSKMMVIGKSSEYLEITERVYVMKKK